VAVLRYLESLPKDTRVGKVILVAGFTDQIGFREFDNFFKKPLNFEKIKAKSIEGFIAIQSSDDPFVAEQYGTLLKEDLGAELITKQEAGHMSGPLDDKESCTELPEVVEEVIDAPVETVTKRTSKVLRKTIISSIALVILFAGAGFGYTYYIDKQNSTALKSSTNAADQQQGQTITPSKPSPNAPEDASLEVLTTPIARSQTDMVSIKTQAYSTCSIGVTYLGGLIAHDPGLTPKTADDFGSVSWNWTISPTAPIGQGSVKITCNFYKKSAMVEGNFQVTAQ
jgi:predicted nucleic acid-binding Zn ribbon protein